MGFMVDPKDGKPSVSLTMMIISFIAVIVACGLQMFKVIDNTGVLMELFMTNSALYFGRRFQSKTGSVDGSTPS